MENPLAAQQALPRRRSEGSPLAVFVEADDGSLQGVDDGGGEVPDLDRVRLADVAVEEDRPVLAAVRGDVDNGARQAACQVRLAIGERSPRWYEVRYLRGVAGDRLLVQLRDVTSLRQLAAEAAVLRHVTELANAAMGVAEVLSEAVAGLCSTFDWQFGRVLEVRDGQLRATDVCTVAAGAEALADRVATERPSGTRIAELAVERSGTVTSRDVPMGEVTLVAGSGKVIAVPVGAIGDVAWVLEFHTGREVVLDDDQRSLLVAVGQQLGSVEARHRVLLQLEASLAELERSNAELERFAYVASHDLQEPLRKIVGFTELLRDHHEAIDDEEDEFRGYIVDSAHRMQRLIKDLLAYSRAGRRELEREVVDLDEVVADVLTDLALRIEETGATVEVEDLPTVLGDDGQLREVLQNLVSNALKYRPEDRPPRIRITQVSATPPEGAEDDRFVAIAVADNGIGIAPEHRDSVFEVFRRLHPAHEYGGTGLGLALVQRIVHRHGGTVTIADSPLGDGIAVRITLRQPQEQ